MKIQGLCKICQAAVSKYKCPKCDTEYCSVNCYKSHKEDNNCEGNKPKQNPYPKTPEIHQKTSLDDDNDCDKISIADLNNLKSSIALKDLLKNPHLRTILCEMDKSGCKEEHLSNLMQEPIFVEFADECLKTIGQGPDIT
uniref:zinc finger HIT domain-containing protein 3-like n=1 Tax=Styela clava TaxID=7725 RepID=UPI00193A9C7A|nr:zinc finger HIT domain-containing protein 3-like [Styela clava]